MDTVDPSGLEVLQMRAAVLELWSPVAWYDRIVRSVSLMGTVPLIGLLIATGGILVGHPRALLIGINYKGTQIGDLPGIELDVRRMQEVARDLGISDIRTLSNHEATLDGIRRAVKDLGRGVESDDLVLVYYSGHGTRVPDRGRPDEEDQRDESLVPFNARRVGENGEDLANALVDDEFGELLAGIGSDRLLVVVDACHSGTAAKNLGNEAVSKAYHYSTKGMDLPATPLRRDRAPDDWGNELNFIGIMAAQDHEEAIATPSGSVLTNALHSAIRMLSRRGTVEVTVEDLFHLVRGDVTEQIERLRAGRPFIAQSPVLFVDRGRENLRQMELPLATGTGDSVRLASPGDDSLIKRWRSVALEAEKQIEMTVSHETVPLHPSFTGTATDCDPIYSEHLVSIEIVVPEDGYLNVINAGQGENEPVVLFPNAKSTQDNSVRKGQKIVLPPPRVNWCLPAASVPTGMDSQWVLILGALSKKKLNFHQDGYGKGQFRTLSSKSARSIVPAGGESTTLAAAGTAYVLIERR